ncbi:MAG: ABC transporter transmembrane domain-containing protein, partial [Myxococcota bacterium]
MLVDFGFDLARRQEPRLWRGAVFSSLSALGEALPVFIAYFVLDGVFQGRATLEWIPWIVAALVASLVFTMLFKTLGGLDSFIASYGLVCDSRLNLADHLRRLPMGFWTARRTGAVGSVLTDEFGLYTEIVTHVWSLVVTHLAKPVALTAVIVVIDWRLGLIPVITIPLAALT